jgi:hypothetical protein
MHVLFIVDFILKEVNFLAKFNSECYVIKYV